MTDGSRNYDEIKNRVGCTVHKTRSELKHDQNFKWMKKEANELIKEGKDAKTEEAKKQIVDEYALKRSEMSKYAQEKYQLVVNSTMEELKGSHPELFDDDRTGNFEGCTSTNGIEGGNWRVKYAVRVPHPTKEMILPQEGVSLRKSKILSL